MRVRVFYHDKCFDGACSASLFTRFHRECIAPDASYELSRAGAPRRRALRRERVHGRRECHRGLQVLGVAAHHLVVRSPPVGIPDAAGSRELSGLPARPGLRGAQVLRSPLHLVHQFSGPHRQNALRVRHRSGGGADSLGRHRGRRKVREPRGRSGDGRAGHEAHADHRGRAGSGVHSAADSAADGDAAGRSLEPAVCGGTAAAAARAPPSRRWN